MACRGLDQLAVGMLEGLGRRLWGFPPRLMRPIVEQLGPIRAVAWFARNMPRYERTLRSFGPLRTHLVCLVVSLHNGCRYCAFGHAYAMELVYFRDRGRLFPIDVATIIEWVGLAPSELRDRLSAVLRQAAMHVEVLWVDRTLAMASGDQRPIDGTEARIEHLVRMFGLLNSIGGDNDVEPDEAHDRINKDTQLKEHVRELREAG